MVIGASVTGLYTYNGSSYDSATGEAEENVVYYEKLSGAPVAGYYTESDGVYTRITNSTATANVSTTYYKKMVKGDWAAIPPKDGTKFYTTAVSLTGGLVGNVYGGGLGNSTIAANVYGDVTVTVNEGVTDPTKGVAFIQQMENPNIGGTIYPTPVSGRVFGCNNHNGTPTGNVTVHVYSTRQLDNDNKILPGHGSSDRKYSYEIQSIYGGGNQADYLPAAGKKSHVIIEGCSDTSIEKVYGGGNSAVVPETDVLIKGAYDIGYAFGGGNGDKPIKKADGTWHENEGAIVIGLASIICQGGKIGQVFGGGDSKGSCGNTNAVTAEAKDEQGHPYCPLHITRLYGAGNKGDVASVNIVLAACSDKAIDYVHGGSYNAHVHGDVHLTITSGILKNVYGGNDARGGIEGNIIVDIEETNGCNPIIIQNLVGGGNEAPYPGTKNVDGVEVPIETRGHITVNVKSASATRIDNVYGGSFMAEANADTEVNINMIKGCKANKGVVIPQEFSYIPNIHDKSTPSEGKITCTINDAIGTIGNVYGGGNMGLVKGNATVNIGASSTVQIMARKYDISTDDPNYGKILDTGGNPLDIEDGKNITATIQYKDEIPLGVHITGDVFGGGRESNVTGDAYVNICAKENGSGIYEAVSEGTEGVSISESVYGGGSSADVLGNTFVRMAGGYVFDGVYGGGLHGSVGTAAVDEDGNVLKNAIVYHTGTEAHSGCIGKIVNYKANTGKCTVVVSGGQVGPAETAMTNGGMKNTGKLLGIDGPVDVGFVFGAGRGDVENPATTPDADFHTFVKETDVTIGGTAFIMASVYGGGENGRVLGDTHVKIQGGQIGCGEGQVTGNGTAESPYVPQRYNWADEDPAKYTECASWKYTSPFLPHDPYAAAGDAEDAKVGTDGHTYYGSVFGGGSGYYPYKKADGTHEWLRSAGAVYGNTVIDITGGHILTCVYGGNETTDVGTYSNNTKGQPLVHESGGKCTINMVGGTLGVPRTDKDAQDHPVTCYLFGAGKGDQRTRFNTWTNVQETEVNISGTARIFGSVFGGGEDGHILGDAKVNIGGSVTIGETTYTAQEGLKIGTTGTSYVLALTAGSTGGNAEVNIMGGTMLGSIYGGGRLASVGIDFTPPTDPLYGQLVDDTNEKTHGHITVNISGGTIGNDVANAKYGGNVFGGSMGRITLLDGTLNPIWPKQAVTKDTEITITGNAVIKKNVYGGSEFGIVRDKAIVNIGGTRNKSTDVVTPSGTPTIHGSVYGGGYGSDDMTPTYITAGDYAPGADYVFTPMIWTGCVSGDTEVNIAGGTVKKNVYGGGEVASVGLINCHVVEDANGDITIGTKKYRYTNLTKHADIEDTGTNEKAYGFALSWPYKFEFISGDPKSDHIGGKATVNVTGGHIGSTIWDDRTGYVFGGSKGQVAFKKKVGDEQVDITDIHEQRYVEGLCANVRETKVNIKYSSTPSGKTPSTIGTEANCIMGAVYGGGEDGHVYENAAVNITNGLIGLSVYGGGKGISTYKGYLRDASTKEYKNTTDNLYSWTAGKVYGNTTVTMTNGHVWNNVYGGGYLASVGKGNYAGGTDDYYSAGYGETLKSDPLWTKTDGFNPDDEITESNKPTTMADYFLSSGKCTISITGGTVGTLNGQYGNVEGAASMTTPTGMVFGGSRGQAAQDVGALSPRYMYAPNFFLGYVNNTEVTIGTESSGRPRIYGQVFGGGRDGHVRGNTHVVVNDGTIGQTYEETEAAGGNDEEYQRYHRGNVYGAGSGLGTWDGTHHGTSSGSVTRNTTVDIYGGTIYNNVYGGGAMATVGPPKIGASEFASSDWSKCTVNIYGGIIGNTTVYDTHKYGGTIYGGSRGDRGGDYHDLAEGETIENYATVLWTEVNINGGSIAGNVYGGARGGQVKKDTKVNLKGGRIYHNAYGGGRGTTAIAADVLGNTTVELNKGVLSTAKGCIVDKIFGCNDLNGTPKGHVLVHVYGTQNKNTAKMEYTDGGKYDKFASMEDGYSITNYSGLTTLAGATGTNVDTYTDILTGTGTDAEKKEALANMIEAIADNKYDVQAVYGGGDLAIYEPTSPNENTEVIIDGCDLTSIKQVYGGGNAASTPANLVRINEAYEIHEVFGGGNGKDAYEKDGYWYENSGANVGYYTTYHYDTSSGGTKGNPYHAVINDNAGTPEERRANYPYGKGTANLIITGGRIHSTYGGSNIRGNVRAEVVTSTEDAGDCPMLIDNSTTAGKNADTDGGSRLDSRCIDYLAAIYGGATDANVYNDVVIDITNGTYGKIFGGNNLRGKIYGSITINVREEGCKPIVIGELYGGGNQADYSIYGFNDDGSARTKAQYEALTPEQKATVTVQRDPQINIISATRIGTIYGGGFDAKMIGNPSINVNMEKGFVAAKYATDSKYSAGYHEVTEHDMNCSYDVLEKDAEGKAILKIGTIGTIFGGGSQGDIHGDTHVDIGTGEWLSFTGQRETTDADGKVYVYNSTTKKWDWTKKVGETTESGTVDNKPAPSRNAAFILGKVVEEKYVGGQVFGGGDQGYVYGNTTVNIANGYIYDRVYGGGNEGTVGTVSTHALPAGHASHDGCLGGKPTAFADNTGRTSVTVSGGYVGPYTYQRDINEGAPTPKAMTMPQDFGYVFGAGRGELTNPATDPDIDFRTYVNETNVIIKNTYEEAFEGDSLAHIVRSPLIAGGVYGGAENGRVLNNTHVNIWGGQIGLGATKTAAYAEADFIDPTTVTAEQIAAKAATMAECASWAYGHDSNSDGKNDEWLPYDEHADNGHYQTETYGAASDTGSDGHTFYGNVFGGGSGYFTYETETTGVYEWLPSAGLVEGDTYVNISGGHILTNVYGGNEMTNVTGTTNVTMTGGTLGVPRTLAQIAAHPVTCYLFGGGKGDQRVHFNKSTNVGHAKVNVSGGIIYGSVFGGGEDGHVLGNVDMTISDNAKIGTWGTSYVDGNVFGGGRGFGGDAYTAGNVAGSVTLNITGGTMLGSIYGGGRLGSVGYGLFSKDEEGYGEMRADNVTEEGFVPVDGLTKGRGHVVVNISGDNTIIGNKYEYQYISPETTGDALVTAKTYLPSTQFESNNRLKHTRGGNVFAGGMGRYTKLDGTSPISTYDGSGNLTSPIEWKKLGNVKSTKLTISGNPWIMGNVYGGGEFGAVQGYHQRSNGETPLVDAENNPIVASTEILFSGGTIGTEITTTDPVKETVETTAARSIVQYTFGSIYGGGMGQESPDATNNHGGDVKDSTYISMSGTSAKVRASVYGGGEVAVVDGNTNVTISGGEIGRNEVKVASDTDPGYVLFGGATIGNVYGGGKGLLEHTLTGLVKGNTNVTINAGETEGQPFIYHNVYGGGALASVGTFTTSTGIGDDAHVPAGIPLHWTSGGTANVTINGGTIGISGRDNGLVFGSSRGDIEMPTGNPAADPYDKVAWVKDAVVIIGEATGESAGPHIKGSVYGGGENGHNGGNATVTVNRGTIGIAPNSTDPWAKFTDETIGLKAEITRGNVYGAGCGTDTYTDTSDGNKEKHNPWSGMVAGNTTVNIKGGYITQNVYGAGSIASVGTVISSTIHRDIDDEGLSNEVVRGFALSWPYEFVYAPNTGKATVNITGGHLGVVQSDGTYTGGDVYGSARGEADNRYAMALLAKVKETEVNINYPTTADIANVDLTDETTQCITGSVHGSGENGFVYDDTHVTLDKGLIVHSLYGGGKGKGTYKKSIEILAGADKGQSRDQDVYGLLSGKVLGNTYVTMNDGHVMRNIYGGGNIASVGKGNYAGGTDDYYPTGYGETLTGNLWDNVSDDSKAFLSSGKTNVNVIGGTVGYVDSSDPSKSIKNNLPYGNVIGGSAGEAAPNIAELPRYLYSPAFFSGYVNETDVTIGGYSCKTAYDTYKVGDCITTTVYNALTSGKDNWELIGPTILASVYGGGQDGHVRRDTKVTVISGEIGMAYNSANQTLLQTTDLDSDQWLHRGNIYGGGSGISKYEYDFNGDDDFSDDVTYNGESTKEKDYSNSSGSVTRFTEVNVLGGTIHRNVYGGGSMGSIGAPNMGQTYLPYKKGDTAEGHGVGKQSQNTVNIGGGTNVVTIGTPYENGWTYNKTYGGEVYGACRGKSDLDPEQFATSIWTQVNIKDKATIMGNVYGGGDNGIVKKDTDVQIGAE